MFGRVLSMPGKEKCDKLTKHAFLDSPKLVPTDFYLHLNSSTQPLIYTLYSSSYMVTKNWSLIFVPHAKEKFLVWRDFMQCPVISRTQTHNTQPTLLQMKQPRNPSIYKFYLVRTLLSNCLKVGR